MAVHDLNVNGIAILPDEAISPLIVDPDAVRQALRTNPVPDFLRFPETKALDQGGDITHNVMVFGLVSIQKFNILIDLIKARISLVGPKRIMSLFEWLRCKSTYQSYTLFKVSKNLEENCELGSYWCNR